MRPIKFRAWDKLNSIMRDVLKIDFIDEVIIYETGYADSAIDFEDCELMQSTGRLDKNHNLIFEGDILRYEELGTTSASHELRPIPTLTPVWWCKELLRYKVFGYPMSGLGYPVEIVGNIYENPELLK